MRHRIKRSLSPELEASFPTLPLGDQVGVLRSMVGRHYSVWNTGNEYHGRPPSEYDQFQRALECGKSYLVGDTWTMAAYKAAYRSTTTCWQRLACLICWGHPETSGHPTIDYFLSSALMEPDDGQRSYVERLVLLPGLGTSYMPPHATTRRSRADFGLPEGRHLYLLPQSLFKIHPDNDVTVAEILAQDAQGMLVLFEGENAWLTEAFRRRLDGALRLSQVDPACVVVLQLMPRDDYLEVNRLCDVMLDTLHWSGGNTTLDALAVGLPVVTRWGHLMRGRQSAGMLRALGRTDLIAQDSAAYVRLALEIARSPSHREELGNAILAARRQLFGDSAPIRRLEDFFASVAHQRQR